jgi:deoxyhypusine synthase
MNQKRSDPGKIQTASVRNRVSKVSVERFSSPFRPGMTFAEFVDSLPRLLAAEDLREIAARIVQASRTHREVIVGMGAHVIKVGLNPVLISWMDRGILTCLAMNGAGVVHDVETALWGKTSEDVGPALDQGMFGVAEETATLINQSVREGVKQGLGFGEAVAGKLLQENPPHADQSLLCQAHRRGIPVTVHVAMGTDIVHMHESADGASIGEASLRDFHRFASRVAALENGVYLNIGSAVVLPEVFLKALNLARNLGNRVEVFTTVNLDFLRQYRSTVNVVERPVRLGGRGYQLIGHHELNLPLLAAAVLEMLSDDDRVPPGGTPRA